MMFELPESVTLIFKTLTDAGYESYLVGGSVRDFCLGQKPHDYDLTTSAEPEETASLFREKGFSVIPTGIRHGTVTVLIDRTPFEITTFRSDGIYADSRHPDQVRFVRNLEEDLARRDFTVNAMAWNPLRGLIDCFGGKEDLERKVIRCVGNPRKRFEEDALRILRALRFASVLDFTIEPETEAALRAEKELLTRISAERIQAELTKLLQGPGVGAILRNYPDVLGVPIPEILPCVGFQQNCRYHSLDVWQHICKAVESSANIPVLRLALLLHDIEKPSCYTENENADGVLCGHFYGHAPASAETAAQILNRLRFDRETVETVKTLIAVHCDPVTASEKQIKRFLSRLGEARFRLLIEHHRGDNLAQTPDIIPERLRLLTEITAITDRILAEKQCFSLRELAVSGGDLLTQNITKEGPRVGILLQQLLDQVIRGAVPNEREALLNKARELTSV